MILSLPVSFAQRPAYLTDTTQIARFYKLTESRTPWLQPVLLQQLKRVYEQLAGTDPTVSFFPIGFLDSIIDGSRILRNEPDSLGADYRLTEASIRLFTTIHYGTGTTPVAYEGIRASTSCIDVTQRLVEAVLSGRIDSLISTLKPVNLLYRALHDTLKALISRAEDTGSKTQSFTTGQSTNGRIGTLRKALHTVQWMQCLLTDQCIVVNIPSATLHYYEREKLLLSSRVIVGKPSTPSGTLASAVGEIILYPYWTVPAKIARRELLPMIKRNPAFLEANGYQVLLNGKLINASSIDWNKYSSSYFPYTLRQSTGCDNSMGIIKLNFHSPFGIFLHDTPWKLLFNAPSRHLSHGCIRVEKVQELARLLLREDSVAFDTILQKGDALNTTPTTLVLKKPVAVVIVYETAWPNVNGDVRYYQDIYQRYQKKQER